MVMLTIIPIDKIAVKGDPCAKMAIEYSRISKEDMIKWDNFGNASIDSGVEMCHS